MTRRSRDHEREVQEPEGALLDDRTKKLAFLLLPSFPLLAFSSALEPLRGANRISGQELYRWRLVSPQGGTVSASSGVCIETEALPDENERFDRIVVCSGVDAHRFDDKATIAWLRRAARGGAQVGAVSDGTYVLARAGLLNDYRCTIHWQCIDGFHETFPDIDLHMELYEIDRGRFTCAGGSAAMDMLLHMIEQERGRELAVRVADHFLHERIRAFDDRQRMSLRLRVGVGHPKLLRAVKLMEENLEAPLSSAALAQEIGVSTRQLERLFQKYLGVTPRAHYVELRLLRAHMMLTHSAMSVTEVGLACGFVSASHFAKRYRERFRQTPQRTRMGVKPPVEIPELPAP